MKSVNISSVLNEGMIVNTKVGSGNIWYQNIVYKCEDNQLCLALVQEYLESTVLIGTTIFTKYANEYFEYLFEGTVTDIKISGPGHITLKISKGEEMINTREFPRYDIYLPSEIRPIWDDIKHFCIAINISLGGMAFVSKHDFDYGEESEVHVFLPCDKIVAAKGKTIRKSAKNDHICYSMQFTEMTEESSILLSNYLTCLDDKLNEIRTHFFNEVKPKL